MIALLALLQAAAMPQLPPMPVLLRAGLPYSACLRSAQQDAPDLTREQVLAHCADVREAAIAKINPVLATKPGFASAERRTQVLDQYFDGKAALEMRALALRPQL
ncbi:hypothetical protein ACBY01_14065 [Sphingomonas sp. ac-8]|uniref:hypothetical protein n=1 Tax=Sphingomonas sp. ac-8 TaxID=3242977 RepID=UPI003A80180C